MKKSIRKLFVIMVLTLALVFPASLTSNMKQVKAATKSVQVKTSKKVKVKNYKLKKKARGYTRTQTSKKKRTQTMTSIAKKVVKVTDTTVVKKTRVKGKKKKITTTTTVKVTTTTTDYTRKGGASANQISGINPKVVKAFNESGYTIEVNPNSSLLRNADGVFSPSNKKIVLAYNVDRVLAHELGHFVSRVTDNSAKTDEFINIWKAEKDNFDGSADSEYESSTNGEFFAGVFAEYTMNPSKLKKTCPRAYAYVANVIAQM